MNKLGRKLMSVVVGLGAFVAVGASTQDASACGGAWMPMIMVPEVDHRIEGVARAEKQFQKDTAGAAASVIRMMPHVRAMKPKSAKLVLRAQRTLAVALVRHGGALPVDKELPRYAQGTWLGKTAEEKKANLEWAVEILRQVNDLKKDDAAVQTDLGEAMAAVDATKAEGRALLEKLAEKDLVASPEAYAALARLRSDAGDHEGTRLAMQRCEAMAGSAAAVCRPAEQAHS